jgi:hypothetical protein
MHLEISGRKAIVVFATILACSMIPPASGQEPVPAEVAQCVKVLGSGYAISGKINPSYLRGDFHGGGKPEYAVVIQKNQKQGVMFCPAGAPPAVIGAGTVFNDMVDMNFTSWHMHPKATRVPRGGRMPPKLLGDALLLEWESASAIIYWNGRRFGWYQQGD